MALDDLPRSPTALFEIQGVAMELQNFEYFQNLVRIQELVHLPYEALYAAASELNAKDLCVLAGAGLEKHTLATLAEDLGSTLPTSTCLDFLLLLLNDSRQIVREGAARGLAAHVSSPQAAAALTTALVS